MIEPTPYWLKSLALMAGAIVMLVWTFRRKP
jgi:hypothetical protein